SKLCPWKLLELHLPKTARFRSGLQLGLWSLCAALKWAFLQIVAIIVQSKQKLSYLKGSDLRKFNLGTQSSMGCHSIFISLFGIPRLDSLLIALKFSNHICSK